MVLSNQNSVAISWLRVLAMFSIVICHFFQALDNHWAYIFNIGVQVFLLISGYLYGHKHIDNWLVWFRKRILRVYVPFLLFFVAIIPLLIKNDLISLKETFIYIVNLQGIVGGIPALGNLWFITIIVFCYAITPILQWSKTINKKLIWAVVVMAPIAILMSRSYGRMVSWFLLYIFGYYLSEVNKYEKCILSVIIVSVMVLVFSHFSWESMINMGCLWSIAFHSIGGIVVFFIGLLIIELLNVKKTAKTTKILDKYSFEVYITHFILIMPPFSMLKITENIMLNIIVVFFFIAFYSFILKLMSKKTIEIIDNIHIYDGKNKQTNLNDTI